MTKNETHGMRDDLTIAAHAMGLSEFIVAVSPRLVMSAAAFLAASYGVLLLIKAVAC